MIPFRKMNGLGNDFAVVDARTEPFTPTSEEVKALGDRATGIGFDQFIIIAEPPAGETALMRIINADGGEVESCGNAARCVAAILLDERSEPEVTIASAGGPMRAWRAGGGRISVDMGTPRFGAADIPLAEGAGDPQALAFSEPELAGLGPAACANVGNPHAVFFVPSIAAVDLATVGPMLEHHPVFPARANISFVEVLSPGHVRAVVHERGVGPTRACGTAACAIAAVGHHMGRLAGEVTVELPGGPLTIGLEGGRIVMTGPYEVDWTGMLGDGVYTRDPEPING
ncbi:diaminopimelate epimerase [Acuticoccus sediminis]|uniref:Diaminopimelate epimerase n=1 Tax=Acuticoccus sediminis TaxID=2184697 RepID=A0A8B2NSY6_9HYPH|nr:diaminopimelate epimerase [Acuticoccus sediminis]RAI03318.1 diaminopimelate epimerase [Acuticoccus sediminis]